MTYKNPNKRATDKQSRLKKRAERGAGTYQGSPCKRGHSGLRRTNGGDCVDCNNVRAREKWASDPAAREKHLSRRRQLYDTDEGRKQRRAIQYKQLYGMTLDAVEEMDKKQDHKCALCGGPPTGQFDRLCVDHDHKTDAVRELLCARCNIGLGSFEDDIETLEKAIVYLKRHGKTRA